MARREAAGEQARPATQPKPIVVYFTERKYANGYEKKKYYGS